MMPTGTRTAGFAPIFDWDSASQRKIPLFSFLAVSLVLHGLCFYLFQIIYPPTVALLPPPARVNLITADSEEGRLLLRWVEAEDPALSSTTQRPAEANAGLPPGPQHVPSYSSLQPALKPLPPYQPDLSIPSAEPPGPVPLPPPPPPRPAGVVATSLHFAPNTEPLGAPEIPPLKFSASTNEPPAAAQFRVAIDALGAVGHCFLERSSGDPALDEQARRYLLLCRFPAAKQDGTASEQFLWTTAAFQWGNDIALPSAASTESPAQ
jgi:hypothetical protein